MGRLKALLSLCLLLLMASTVSAEGGYKVRWKDFWWTPAQQGQRAFDNDDFESAAKQYRDPMHIGSAYFRAGDFAAAAAAFGRVDTPEGSYNSGTARLMGGNYTDAILAFDRALSERPGWVQAEQNRDIARARKDKLEFESDQHGKPTEIGADDVVFDLDSTNKSNQEEGEGLSEYSQTLSDRELRALWLRKSQTSPAVFLKAKFRAQLASESRQDAVR